MRRPGRWPNQAAPDTRSVPVLPSTQATRFAMFPFIPSRHIPRRGRASRPGRGNESGSGGGAAHARGPRGVDGCKGRLLTARPPSSSGTLRERIGWGAHESPRGGLGRVPGWGGGPASETGRRAISRYIAQNQPAGGGEKPGPAPPSRRRTLPSASPGPRAPQTLTVEVNAAVVVLVPVLHQGFELLVCHVLPGGSENLRQLLGVDVAVRVPAGV